MNSGIYRLCYYLMSVYTLSYFNYLCIIIHRIFSGKAKNIKDHIKIKY